MDILGIDIGGSGIKGAPVRVETGELVSERHRVSTPLPATPKGVARAVGALVEEFNWSGPVGCGFPAAVQREIVRTASNIDPEWIGTDAAALFKTVAPGPWTVVNDADAAGLAEMRFGAGRGEKGVVLVVTVGTGLGTALFTEGRLLPNTELGHVRLGTNGKIAEKFASSAVRKAKGLSWEEWAKRFDQVLRHLEDLLWPDLIIVGGGASRKAEKFFSLLTVRTRTLPAVLQNHAGIIGAALAAAENANGPVRSGP